jgi:hypothetical protein
LFYGNKKNEILKVAQDNLFMLKRLSEKSSCYNVDKWNQDYEASQYYKRNHCLHPPIDFNKTQKQISSFRKYGFNRKKFFSKTHYASTGKLEYIMPSKRTTSNTKRKKKFEDFNYRDLNLDEKLNNKLDIKEKDNKQFKRISEIESEEKEEKKDNSVEEKSKNDEEKNNEKENEKNEEEKDDGNEGLKEPKKNERDEKEEKKKTENNKE